MNNMETDKPSEELNDTTSEELNDPTSEELNDPIKYLASILEGLGYLHNIHPGDAIVFFERNNGQLFMLSIVEQGTKLRLMTLPWIDLYINGPAFSTFMRIADEAKATYDTMCPEIGYFKTKDGERAFVICESIIDCPISKVNGRTLDLAITNMAIMIEWIASHFLVEAEHNFGIQDYKLLYRNI